MTNPITCPHCHEVCCVPDPTAVCGFRRVNTAGCVQVDGDLCIITCCFCGQSFGRPFVQSRPGKPVVRSPVPGKVPTCPMDGCGAALDFYQDDYWTFAAVCERGHVFQSNVPGWLVYRGIGRLPAVAEVNQPVVCSEKRP